MKPIWIDEFLGNVVEIVPAVVGPEAAVEGSCDVGEAPLGAMKALGDEFSIALTELDDAADHDDDHG